VLFFGMDYNNFSFFFSLNGIYSKKLKIWKYERILDNNLSNSFCFTIDDFCKDNACGV
jgi:hypothetical protein